MKINNNDIDRSRLGQLLLDYGLRKDFNTSLRDNIITKNEYGKPFFSNDNSLYFNISHCHDYLICCIANSEVGIDIEEIRPFCPKVAKRVCSKSELQDIENAKNRNLTFFSIWTLKESLGKAMGCGLEYLYRDVTFRFNDHEVTSNKSDYNYFLSNINDNHVMAISILKDR